ncbi:anti-sigma factor [Phreatobacter stygius]|uniref:Anti-sigma K factor RskA C-terminal domain-containing protein n=1 Tax=Phreatobacter stygius TaxID=1940610 RepID=A0A4D7AUU3_9HYPH|nr:anti-sigma factor [Phreatobacter stygius]QCI62793.1 hypothetical protein E8M01_00175 [Phreatobacter stygius]
MTDEIIASAGEYVAGLMSKDENEAFERLMVTDPEVRRAVADWRARLLPLDEAAPPIEPSAELWAGIERAIGAAPAAPAAPASTGLVGRAKAFWADVRALRIAALAGVAAAFVLAAVLLVRPLGPPAGPVVVAVLNAPNTQTAGAIVEAFADGRIRVVPLTPIPVPEGRTLQVWTLWDRAVGPRSIGLMTSARGQDYRTSGLPAPVADQLYEITLEPAGGSPTGRPTGPILFVGRGATPL